MTTTDRPRPGQPALERFVKDEVARRYRSPKRFLAETDIQKSSYYMVITDSSDIGSASFRALEGALDLPHYILDYIADEDIDALKRAGLEPDQLRAVINLLDEELLRRADEMLIRDQQIGDERRATG